MVSQEIQCLWVIKLSRTSLILVLKYSSNQNALYIPNDNEGWNNNFKTNIILTPL